MTGDGPVTTPARAGTLVVLGTGSAGADPSAAADLLAGADAVFTAPGTPDPESEVLFYAEAWRVERLAPREAAGRLDAWFAARPGATAVLVTAGDPAHDVASGAAGEGLRRIRPGLVVRRPAGVRVVAPQRSTLAF
ncbi:MAG: hypothetical protein ABW212_11125 [Pseudonocardia sediminis]